MEILVILGVTILFIFVISDINKNNNANYRLILEQIKISENKILELMTLNNRYNFDNLEDPKVPVKPNLQSMLDYYPKSPQCLDDREKKISEEDVESYVQAVVDFIEEFISEYEDKENDNEKEIWLDPKEQLRDMVIISNGKRVNISEEDIRKCFILDEYGVLMDSLKKEDK